MTHGRPASFAPPTTMPHMSERWDLGTQALLFAAVFLLALAYVSMSDIRAGGAQGAAAGLGGRTGGGNFGLRMLSSLGVGGAVGGAVSGRQEPASEMPVRAIRRCDVSMLSSRANVAAGWHQLKGGAAGCSAIPATDVHL